MLTVPNELALTESRTMRAATMDRTDVLDKVKALTMLPDGLHVTTEIAADYYEVTIDVVKKVVERNRLELTENGYSVLRGQHLRDFESDNPSLSKRRAIALFSKRTMLNLGELITGSGWLLWPAAAAAVVAVTSQFVDLGGPMEIVLFVVAAVLFTYLGRRFLPPAPKDELDVNDTTQRLVGREGETVAPFADGLGRVFVDGKEWAAELDGGGDLAARSKIRVLEILGGARLKVTAG